MFKFCKSGYVCTCNKCGFMKTDLMKELDELRRRVANLTCKISNLELMRDDTIKCDAQINNNVAEYEELMIWGKDE